MNHTITSPTSVRDTGARLDQLARLSGFRPAAPSAGRYHLWWPFRQRLLAHGQQVHSRDPDASDTLKRGQPDYGYKVHVAVDHTHKLVRRANLTGAQVYDTGSWNSW